MIASHPTGMAPPQSTDPHWVQAARHTARALCIVLSHAVTQAVSPLLHLFTQALRWFLAVSAQLPAFFAQFWDSGQVLVTVVVDVVDPEVPVDEVPPPPPSA
jgi:hypothetical protein